MSTRIELHVIPKAKRTAVAGMHDGRIKLEIAAPPVDGKANLEVVRFLSKTLKLKKADVRLVSGLTSRQKVVELDGLSLAEVFERLGLDVGAAK
ncbi:MAG: YggU family protein [Deltaproteobacteria bacterium CG2_30_63_29]|nr:MAG: YggU family protein [Deltaproteobacteria bacterium CG2_30_63_29]PJB38207.1 MAG: YggU family protein [Deltaproteobacteria bacterium CG_4_9_14_3_um_filter_63_12]